MSPESLELIRRAEAACADAAVLRAKAREAVRRHRDLLFRRSAVPWPPIEGETPTGEGPGTLKASRLLPTGLPETPTREDNGGRRPSSP